MRQLALVTVILFPTCATADTPPPPGGPPKGPVLYYPTKVGDKKVYPTNGAEITEVVTAVEDTAEGKVVSVNAILPGDQIVELNKVLVTEKGLFTTTAGGHPLTAPMCTLKLPVKPGEEWVATAAARGLVHKATRVAAAPEKVVVPAGEFLAIPVTSVYTVDGRTTRSTTWYAPGVGFVKSVRGDTVTELKSFTPGTD